MVAHKTTTVTNQERDFLERELTKVKLKQNKTKKEETYHYCVG